MEKKPDIVSANEFPRICIQTFEIHGSEMTYSNHKILRHFRRIIALSCFRTEISLSFRPYTSSRAAREPISMHFDADFVGSFNCERANNGY
jgi:hypothetical protein